MRTVGMIFGCIRRAQIPEQRGESRSVRSTVDARRARRHLALAPPGLASSRRRSKGRPR